MPRVSGDEPVEVPSLGEAPFFGVEEEGGGGEFGGDGGWVDGGVEVPVVVAAGGSFGDPPSEA